MDNKTKAVLMLREKKINAFTYGLYVYIDVNGITLKLDNEEICKLSNMYDELDL